MVKMVKKKGKEKAKDDADGGAADGGDGESGGGDGD